MSTVYWFLFYYLMAFPYSFKLFLVRVKLMYKNNMLDDMGCVLVPYALE
jgi:hypothetical protein